MKSYFAYIRVSTVKQGEHGSSLQEQRGAIEAYSQRHGLTITAWFEEQETAAKQGRKEFARLTSLLRHGKASGVIIHKIDRSARNLKDWAGLGELIDAGVDVLFAHEGLDMQTRGGRLAADIQAVVAADFIRNLRDEVRKGFYGRLKQGYYPLPAPRGYLDRGKAQVKEIDPVTGPLVRHAFELYATGNFSHASLSHHMAELGLVSTTGKPLVKDAIALMLHNPFYMGLIRIYRTGEAFEGKHEPLVTKALFDRVQDVMAGRIYPRVQKHEFLFRRLIRCRKCGRSLTGERQKGHIYYRCHERACKGVSLAEGKIERLIAEELSYLQLDAKGPGDLRDLFEEQVAKEQAQLGNRISAIERDIGLIDQRLARLTDLLIDLAIDKDTYNERKADLLVRKRALQDQLDNDEDSTFWRIVSERFELGLDAYTGYLTGNAAEKRDLVKLVGSNLVAHGKQPVLTMAFPFNEIRNWAKSSNGAPYRGAVRTFRVGHSTRRHRNVRSLLARIAAHRSHAHWPDPAICAAKSPSSPQVPHIDAKALLLPNNLPPFPQRQPASH